MNKTTKGQSELDSFYMEPGIETFKENKRLLTSLVNKKYEIKKNQAGNDPKSLLAKFFAKKYTELKSQGLKSSLKNISIIDLDSCKDDIDSKQGENLHNSSTSSINKNLEKSKGNDLFNTSIERKDRNYQTSTIFRSCSRQNFDKKTSVIGDFDKFLQNSFYATPQNKFKKEGCDSSKIIICAKNNFFKDDIIKSPQKTEGSKKFDKNFTNIFNNNEPLHKITTQSKPSMIQSPKKALFEKTEKNNEPLKKSEVNSVNLRKYSNSPETTKHFDSIVDYQDSAKNVPKSRMYNIFGLDLEKPKENNRILIEDRLKSLITKSNSKYIKDRIQKNLSFVEDYKKSIDKDKTLHNTLKWIFADDKKKLENVGLNQKYSGLNIFTNKDVEIQKFYDVDIIKKEIEKRFQKIENEETHLSRLIEKETQRVQEEETKNFERKFITHHKKVGSDFKNLASCLNEQTNKELFEKKMNEQVNSVSNNASVKKFSRVTEIKHKFYENYWSKEAKDVLSFERRRNKNKTWQNLKKIINPLTEPLYNNYRNKIVMSDAKPKHCKTNSFVLNSSKNHTMRRDNTMIRNIDETFNKKSN